MTEEWKAIEGYEGIYQVSSFGRVRSLDRTIIKPHPKTRAPTEYFQRGRIVKTHPARNGYIGVMLKADGQKRNERVHRLVARAFVSGYFDGAEVNHKDFNRQNNRADNLEWVTRSANLRYHTHDTTSAMERIHESQRKPIVQMTLDGNLIREWSSVWEAHCALGIDRKTLWGCCAKPDRYKSAGGYLWKFKD